HFMRCASAALQKGSLLTGPDQNIVLVRTRKHPQPTSRHLPVVCPQTEALSPLRHSDARRFQQARHLPIFVPNTSVTTQRDAVLFAVGGWFVLSVLQVLIGWIVRGFCGIPWGRD